MALRHPFQVIGYHSCDKQVGLDVISGKTALKPSNNNWDWLGNGIYFWEHDPWRALRYAESVANGKQFNKKRIETPFVIGAVINLGQCFNLIDSESLSILKIAYDSLIKAGNYGLKIPANIGPRRNLDCAVIKYANQLQIESSNYGYDTVRASFDEGEKVYEGASFTSLHHLQICVINEKMIEGYFLPRPLENFNPYL